MAEEPQAWARGRCWARCTPAFLGCFMAAAAQGQRSTGFIQAERIMVLPSSPANGASLFFLILKIKNLPRQNKPSDPKARPILEFSLGLLFKWTSEYQLASEVGSNTRYQKCLLSPHTSPTPFLPMGSNISQGYFQVHPSHLPKFRVRTHVTLRQATETKPEQNMHPHPCPIYTPQPSHPIYISVNKIPCFKSS